MRAKHVVIGLGLIGLGCLYVNDRVKKLTEIMAKLIPIPTGFRNWSFKNWVLYFNMDVEVYNPTDESFNPNGVIVTVKRIEVKTVERKLIAKIEINKNSVIIPAKGKYTFKDLAVAVSSYDVLANAESLIKIKSIDDIKIDVVISVLGTEHVIPQL